MTARTEPLAGVVVLELGSFITGPYAGLLLADLGATVIKIERPEGDPFRSFRGGQYSPNFVAYNRNKRSVKLDLSSPADREVFLAMADQADVVLENFRPGGLDKLGIGCDVLRARNPRLVYCAIAGFPPGSESIDRPAFDAIGQAQSGMLNAFLDPEDPEVRGPTIADQVAGMYACYGILGALAGRAANGEGRRVDVNMAETAMSFMPDFFASFTREGTLMESTTRAAYSHTFAFRCADGELVGVQLSSPEKFWQSFTKALQASELAADERFSNRGARIQNFKVLTEVLRGYFAKQPREYWLKALTDADVPHSAVRRVDEVMADPALQACGTFRTVTHPEMGDVTCIERPVLFDGGREPTRYPPPVLGEHTAEVLRELGIDPAAPTQQAR
ncbi:CoA transferase [Diaphorobacter sp. NR2-3-3-1]|nr:CoA transferase [Diaphorobacter caeni]